MCVSNYPRQQPAFIPPRQNKDENAIFDANHKPFSLKVRGAWNHKILLFFIHLSLIFEPSSQISSVFQINSRQSLIHIIAKLHLPIRKFIHKTLSLSAFTTSFLLCYTHATHKACQHVPCRLSALPLRRRAKQGPAKGSRREEIHTPRSAHAAKTNCDARSVVGTAQLLPFVVGIYISFSHTHALAWSAAVC